MDKLIGEIEMHKYNALYVPIKRREGETRDVKGKKRNLSVFLKQEAEWPDDSLEVTGQRCSGSLKPTWEPVQDQSGDHAPVSRGAASLPERQTGMWTPSRDHPRYTQPT